MKKPVSKFLNTSEIVITFPGFYITCSFSDISFPDVSAYSYPDAHGAAEPRVGLPTDSHLLITTQPRQCTKLLESAECKCVPVIEVEDS